MCAQTLTSPRRRGSLSSDPHSMMMMRKSRKQVSRACDWCRTRRIGCDNGQPCAACVRRGTSCTRNGNASDEPRTLPQALRELTRWKNRAQELENELRGYRKTPAVASMAMTTPEESAEDSVGSRSSRSSQLQGSSPASFALPSAASPRPQWQGIFVATGRNDQTSYYGPASSLYFISRIGGYLGKALQQPFADRNLHPAGASGKTHLEAFGEADARVQVSGPSATLGGSNQQLDRMQEESLLRLFWESYHCLYPIIDEFEFRRLHANLWENAQDERRKQSPLVDIIIALCLQYGSAFMPRVFTQGKGHGPLQDDAALAGRWYYRRAQSLLMADLESPALATIQSYIFTMVYLCCASFQNMCHIVNAQAVRAAQILGLHLEPSPHLPRGERELRKRVWWVLWTMDAKISAKHGRPFSVDWAYVTVTPPSDDLESAFHNGATLGSYGDGITWLTYSIHYQRAFVSMVAIHDALFFKCGEVLCKDEPSCIYNSPESLESCAKLLTAQLPAMRAWAEQVPAELKMPRRGENSMPYSNDRSAVVIDDLAPTWLQRQRVCLELTYHNIMATLTRPFVTFYSHPGTYTPLTERHATTCINHAMTFTAIMHQALTTSDLLEGWTEYFSLQWNVAITLVGFVLANPIHPATPRARQALDKAVAVFDTYGQTFAASKEAAAITRNLLEKAEALMGSPSSGTSSVGLVKATPTETDIPEMNLDWLDPLQFLDTYQMGQNSQISDWALSVDSLNGLGGVMDVSNFTDMFAFSQM